MDYYLNQIKTKVYRSCSLEILNFRLEQESREYAACRFELNGKYIVCRTAKITPKKSGLFVTFWKRNEGGPIEPFNETDETDFYVVNVHTEKKIGQFVFPKSILIKKGIVSTKEKEGKRAFRVYPGWDIPNNKQAERTQKWQLNYFYEVNNSIDFKRVLELHENK